MFLALLQFGHCRCCRHHCRFSCAARALDQIAFSIADSILPLTAVHRPDVVAAYPGRQVLGFSLLFDLSEHINNIQDQSITLTVQKRAEPLHQLRFTVQPRAIEIGSGSSDAHQPEICVISSSIVHWDGASMVTCSVIAPSYAPAAGFSRIAAVVDARHHRPSSDNSATIGSASHVSGRTWRISLTFNSSNRLRALSGSF